MKTPSKEYIADIQKEIDKEKSMRDLIVDDLKSNCEKFNPNLTDKCIDYLFDCAKEILCDRSGEIPNNLCFRICRDYFNDEVWKHEEEEEPETEMFTCPKCAKICYSLYEGLCYQCFALKKKKENEIQLSLF